MKLRSVYHTAQGEKFFSVGRWIILWTGFLAMFYKKGKALKYNFSHEELWIPDEDMQGCPDFSYEGKGTGETVYRGQCFSSTTRGGAKGVRFAPASEVLKHPERWRYIEFEVDDEAWEALLPLMEHWVGTKYDFLGIAGFFGLNAFQDECKWYCSEICGWAKSYLGVESAVHPISPRRSAMLLVPDWGEPKSV